MKTKEFDSSLGDNRKVVNGNFASDQNAQYSNLNLNANHKCSSLNPIQSKKELINSKSTKNYNGKSMQSPFLGEKQSPSEADSGRLEHILLKNLKDTYFFPGTAASIKTELDKSEGQKSNNNSWNKTDKSFHLNDLNINNSKEGAGNDIGRQKRWKNKSLSKDSKSTLSLHIEAYENSVQVENEQNEHLKPKPSKSNKVLEPYKGFFPGLKLKNAFEFPRQQDEEKSEPKVMQEKASRPFLNPNGQTNVKDAKMPVGSMNSLITVMGKLQSVLSTIHMENPIKFPQIVAVGEQSAGKSSVIEGIVGRDFLPRGTGIVTRRPLLIQLIHTPLDDQRRKMKNKSIESDWATFEHLPDQEFVDFEEVRKEIEKTTDEEGGQKKGISKKPIGLKIFSATVVDLTLVDLPGITKIPVGEQPADIEELILDLINEYISNENSIILAVTGANRDFATSECLKFARKVDKDGNRTLAVLTKLDLMDDGTDAIDVLTGSLVPVKLGIIGVVGRSQADIKAGKTVAEGLEKERIYLNKKYPTLAATNGTNYLAQRLSELLLKNIREVLPELKDKVATMKCELDKKRKEMGEPISDDEKKTIPTKVIHDFVRAFENLISGNSDVVETSKDVGGALLHKVFFVDFAEDMKIDALKDLENNQILTAQRNVQGSTNDIFPNQKVFEALAKRQIQMLEDPSLKCVDLVHKALESILVQCSTETKSLQINRNRFPLLFIRITKEITSFLEARIVPTKTFIRTYFAAYLFRINTSHSAFVPAIEKSLTLSKDDTKDATIQLGNNSDTSSVSSAEQQSPTQGIQNESTGELQPKEVEDVERTKYLIKAYFDIMHKIVEDGIPKFCETSFVQHINEFLLPKLYEEFQKIENIQDLLCENEKLAQQRKEASEMLNALTKANDILNDISGTL